MDVTGWDFEQQKSIALKGQWEFYWQQLLTPENFKVKSLPDPFWLDLPAFWNQQQWRGQKLPDMGYGTYRLTILNDASQATRALKLPVIHTAYKLWVNERLMVTKGNPGESQEEMLGQIRPQLVLLETKAPEIILTLQISNFLHPKSGIFKPIEYGLAKHLIEKEAEKIYYGFIFLGCFLIIGGYHLFLYLGNPKERSALYFSLTCLLMALRIFLYEDTALSGLLEEIPYEWLSKLRYLSFYALTPTIYTYFAKILPKYIPRRSLPWFQLLCLAFCLLVVLTPSWIHTYSKIYFNVFAVAMLYLVLRGVLLAAKYREKNSRIILAGTLILIVTISNDFFYFLELTPVGPLLSWGLLAVLICQSYLNSRYHSLSLSQAKRQDQENRELKLQEQQLIEAKLVAEKALKTKSQFLAIMSHEIRTPLNGIIGSANILKTKNLDTDSKDFVETILTSGKILLVVINDILDFSKIESGKLTLEQQPVGISECIEDVFRLLQPLAREKQIQLIYEERTLDLPWITGDQTRLYQILMNLINNAIKFTEQGEIHVRVEEVKRQASSIELQVAIQDTGIGIAPDQLAGLFDSFTQADLSTTRKFGGTGLGLSICKKLVQLMGGKIWLESQLNVGTTFFFTLQAPMVEKPIESGNSFPKRPDSLQKNKRVLSARLKIMVAEDNKINQKIALSTLDILGYSADLAENGKEVLELLKEQTYDLIFMDIQMPELDGLQTTRLIHKLPLDHSPVIIAMTANTSLEDQKQYLDAGMDDFIAKPFVLEFLESKLKHWGATLASLKKEESPVRDTPLVKTNASMVDHPFVLKLQENFQVEILNELLGEFQRMLQEHLGELAEDLQARDFEQIQAKGHKIKGASLALGAKHIVTICRRLEEASHEEDHEKIQENLQHLQQAIQPTLTEFKRILPPS